MQHTHSGHRVQCVKPDWLHHTLYYSIFPTLGNTSLYTYTWTKLIIRYTHTCCQSTRAPLSALARLTPTLRVCIEPNINTYSLGHTIVDYTNFQVERGFHTRRDMPLYGYPQGLRVLRPPGNCTRAGMCSTLCMAHRVLYIQYILAIAHTPLGRIIQCVNKLCTTANDPGVSMLNRMWTKVLSVI